MLPTGGSCYSIIIPHKNIPNLLERCLNSIPRRDDTQIIVVDDNSDPDVVDFSRFPGLGDPRVEIVFDKNESGRRGAGYARNLGIERARGKWLVFADADDFFHTTLFEDAMNRYRHSDADMVCFSIDRVDSENTSVQLSDDICRTIEEVLRKGDIDFARHSSVAWAKFIRRELVAQSNIRFQETMYCNDAFFSILIGDMAKNVILDATRRIYCYTLRRNSLTYPLNCKCIEERYRVMKSIMMYLKKYRGPVNATFFNRNLLQGWSNLQAISTLLFIREFPRVLFYATQRKEFVNAFLNRGVFTVKSRSRRLFAFIPGLRSTHRIKTGAGNTAVLD